MMSKKVIIIGILILGGFIFLAGYFLNFKYLFAGINRCCGNGRLDWGEECDRTVSETDYLNSPYAKDLDGDTDIDSVDYNIMKNTCNDECSFGCPPSDPHFIDINKGCYQPEGSSDPCQKGVWACDYHTGEVKCLDVYSQETEGYEDYYMGEQIFDYCCEDGGSALSSMSFDRIRIPSTANCGDSYCQPWGSGCNFSGCGNAVTCDEICREHGKVCIGVGLMDASSYHCVYVIHNISPNVTCDDGVSGSNCQNPGNLTTINCKDQLFGLTSPTCVECYDSDLDGNTESYTFHVGEAVCYCK